jgi:peroxiredoxin
MKILLSLIYVSNVFANISWQNIKAFEYVQKNVVEKKYNNAKNNVGVFFFLSASCPCSRGYFEYLNELADKYKGFNFAAFHSSKVVSRDTAQRYFDKYEINFPIFDDKSLKYANQFQALKTPHVFVVNGAGEIMYSGGVANSRNMKKADKFYLEKVLEEISHGKEPSVKNTRVLGCYISR